MVSDEKGGLMALTNEKLIELYRKMKEIGYVSTEFWEYHDQLVPLLIFGVTKAMKQGNEEIAQKFEDLREEVKENTPSGYWK